MTITLAKVYTSFEGIHNWTNCNIPAVDFLRHPHHHTFVVTVKVEEQHGDRDVEFIMLKDWLSTFVSRKYGNIPPLRLESRSCEMIAKDVLESLQEKFGYNRYVHVEVSEDGQRSAEVMTRI